jgi:hypothetical protein
VAISLLTRNYREAEYRAICLDRAFAGVVWTMQVRSKIAAILRQHLREEIARDEDRWLRTPAGQPAYAYWVENDEGPLQADIAATEGWLAEARTDAQGRYFTGYDEAVDAIIAEHALSDTDRTAVAFGLVQARIEMLQARLRRLRGNGPDVLGAALPAVKEANISLKVPSPDAAEPVPKGPLLSEVLPSALDFLSKEEGWRGQTLSQNRTTYRMFIEHCGDRPVQSYGKPDLTSFYDVLRGLPALYSKKPEWRGLSTGEIVERTRGEQLERLAMKTVKRHFSALGPGCVKTLALNSRVESPSRFRQSKNE